MVFCYLSFSRRDLQSVIPLQQLEFELIFDASNSRILPVFSEQIWFNPSQTTRDYLIVDTIRSRGLSGVSALEEGSSPGPENCFSKASFTHTNQQVSSVSPFREALSPS